ncbi:energy-coupling factor transporter transmembrane component T family protein [Paenisporosarcina sp. TG-14]|uniref:energy-coupling factor transporter transmembrane component T family protein n=1 Tax=Paenisporosarcina sp. TG-14 TaxID=1231057 RepID=UPI0003139407|nr:energy-coupling factor transporter transmembrane component T [Paenisporosarcina sp. TG-14]
MASRAWLHAMNPSLKFILVLVSMLTLAWFFNPWTPFLFFTGVILLQLLFSRVNWKIWCLFMIPIGFTAIGYLWTTVLFAADTSGEVIFVWRGFEVTNVQWNTALSLAFRVFAFSSMSMMFAFTTDPVKFVMSLMQQLRLSPKLAYGVMVGYQFLPVVKDELIQIRHAHRLRGIGEEKHMWQRLLGMRRLLIPLLAGAVRRAERTAFAMEARGFTGERRSTYYEPIRIVGRDWLLTAIIMGLLLGSCVAGLLLSY